MLLFCLCKKIAEISGPVAKGGLHEEKRPCKFHMKTTGKNTNDNFNRENLQWNKEVVNDVSNPEQYSGIYKELSELLGDNATIKIWKYFSGLNVTFPQRLYSKEFTRAYIAENMNDMKPAEMAKTMGLSERRIRQIIAEIKKDEEYECD